MSGLLKEPNQDGYWWCVTEGYAETIGKEPVYIWMKKGKPGFGHTTPKLGTHWIPIERYLRGYSIHIYGWVKIDESEVDSIIDSLESENGTR